MDFENKVYIVLGQISDKSVTFRHQNNFFQIICYCHLRLLIVPYHCEKFQNKNP